MQDHCNCLLASTASLLLPCKFVCLYHFSRFHIYALIYDICFFLSDLLHSERQTLGPFVHPNLYKWPNFIPLYGWVIFHCIHVPHLCPFIWDGHLAWFYVLAIVYSAAMNFGVHVSSWISFFPDTCPRVRFVNHMATLVLFFKRNLHTVIHSVCTNLHSYQLM